MFNTAVQSRRKRSENSAPSLNFGVWFAGRQAAYEHGSLEDPQPCTAGYEEHRRGHLQEAPKSREFLAGGIGGLDKERGVQQHGLPLPQTSQGLALGGE